MDNLIKNILVSIASVLVALAVILVHLVPHQSAQVGGVDILPVYSGVATSVSCPQYSTSTSAFVIATSTSRNYIRIFNLSSNTIYLAENQLATTSAGIAVTASSTFVSDSNNLFAGAFYCVDPSGTSTLSVEEQK